MKKLCLLFQLVITALIANCQNNYPVPEYSNVPMFYDSKSNSIFPIEKMMVTRTTRPTSPVTMESLVYVDGMSSKIRFTSNSTISFITKLKVTDIDPSEYVVVVKFKVNENKNRLRREYILSNVSPYHAESTKPKLIPCSYKKIDTGVVMLTLSNLEPGEYFINYDTEGNYVYCFGIDNN